VSSNVDGDLLIKMSLDTNIYALQLQTPSGNSELRLCFGASGLVSIDAMKNYGNTTFKPENDSYFSGQNANMSNTLDNPGS
jgi:hypothetical protein